MSHGIITQFSSFGPVPSGPEVGLVFKLELVSGLSYILADSGMEWSAAGICRKSHVLCSNHIYFLATAGIMFFAGNLWLLQVFPKNIKKRGPLQE